jgi:hypothetical protein
MPNTEYYEEYNEVNLLLPVSRKAALSRPTVEPDL